ncbi:SDR family oxidoreductase [Nesterenkonia sandarakina]|uniref:Short subunit dehydrogenase n=1 Tax=Nesterenkonia sandarakina TaxID=272918 RepID=A0A2T0YLC6_9MICC|nr:SDR family oxidoreductase [Nesterenkonia sandarakina]PRZ16080.1 short subunit dehydrogenase [Nesterenkonia sandarakina]
MTTIALIGAGRGLGAAVARRFGREGFNLALISRSQERVDAFAEELNAEGFTAKGFQANVRDTRSLTEALDKAVQELDPSRS